MKRIVWVPHFDHRLPANVSDIAPIVHDTTTPDDKYVLCILDTVTGEISPITLDL